MATQAVAQSVPVSPYEDKDYGIRVLRYGDKPLIVRGSPSFGWVLQRGPHERLVKLSGDSLDRAYYNAAMGLLSSTDEEALFAKRDPFPKREPRAGTVYFIGGDVGAVKIGFAVNARLRIKGLQCGSPIPLRILATVDGMPQDERDYHKRFKAHRLHGEWFERCPEIEAEIERLKTNAFIRSEP